jgi:hypothetical protein
VLSSAEDSHVAHVVEPVEQTPEEHVPPSHEFPHAPQSVLEVWRFWQPSVQLV